MPPWPTSSTPQLQRDVLENRTHAIEGLRNKRKGLQQQIEQLDRELLEALQEYAELHNSMLPIARLSSDVFAIIFQTVQRQNMLRDVPGNSIAEVTISHVCAPWRILALSMPSLWSIFHYDGRGSGPVPLDRFQAYLDRSGQYPLELYIAFGDSGSNEDIANMLQFVPKHLHRCRRLQIFLDRDPTPREGFLRNTVKLDDGFAPILESLSISPDNFIEETFNTQYKWLPNVLCSGAPSLKYVRLDGASITNFRPPLDSVVNLCLERRGYPSHIQFSAKVFNYILALPYLETLSLTTDFFQFDHPEPPPLPIEANSLKHFRCSVAEDGEEDMACYFLSFVSSLSLKTIGFYHVNLESPLLWERKDYCYPSLHSLTLISVEGLTHSSFATLTQKIKHLVLSDSNIQHDWDLQDLFASGMQKPWEDLEELTVDYPTGLSHGELVRMWPKLKTLHVRPNFVEGREAPSVSPVIKVTADDVPFTPDFDWDKNEEDPYSERQPDIWEVVR